MKERFSSVFATKTQDEWVAVFKGTEWWPFLTHVNYVLCVDVYVTDTDACVEPVLSLKDAPQHPHNKSVTSPPSCLLVDMLC